LEAYGLVFKIPLLAGDSARPFGMRSSASASTSARRGDMFLGFGVPIARLEKHFAWSLTPAVYGSINAREGPYFGDNALGVQLGAAISRWGLTLQPIVRYFRAGAHLLDNATGVGVNGFGYDLVLSWQVAKRGQSMFTFIYEINGAATTLQSGA